MTNTTKENNKRVRVRASVHSLPYLVVGSLYPAHLILELQKTQIKIRVVKLSTKGN